MAIRTVAAPGKAGGTVPVLPMQSIGKTFLTIKKDFEAVRNS